MDQAQVEALTEAFLGMFASDTADQDSDQEDKPNRVHSCSNCDKEAPKMFACSKCKAAKYCSKQCQKEDWPHHKEFCAKAAEIGLVPVIKNMRRFYHSSLHPYFEYAILYKMRAMNLEFSKEKTVAAVFFVGFEPVDLQDFRNILISPEFVESGRRPLGMPQILNLSITSIPTEEAMNKSDYASTRQSQIERGCSFLPIIVIYFAHRRPDANSQIQDYPWGLCTPFTFFDLSVADRPQTITIPTMSGSGHGIKKRKSADTCLEYINMSVRLDHQNQHHVRKKMSREDVKALQRTMRGRRSEVSIGLEIGYMHKIYREDIYESMPETKRLKEIISEGGGMA